MSKGKTMSKSMSESKSGTREQSVELELPALEWLLFVGILIIV